MELFEIWGRIKWFGIPFVVRDGSTWIPELAKLGRGGSRKCSGNLWQGWRTLPRIVPRGATGRRGIFRLVRRHLLVGGQRRVFEGGVDRVHFQGWQRGLIKIGQRRGHG